MSIDNFYPRTPYYFLSNFSTSPFEFMGIEYQTVEHFYQAAKTITPEAAESIISASTAKEAKKLGKHVMIRTDWDDIKLGVMELALRLKFQDDYLRKKLLDTGEEHLEEGNYWEDRFWGTVDNIGENHLGKLLMKLREEYGQGN